MRRWILFAALVLSCKNDGKDDELFALCDDDGDGFVEAECAQADPDGVYDCDDVDPNAFPGATEACNGVDDDCDGTIDNGDVAVFSDVDGDGFGNDDDASNKCGEYDGFTATGGDCNDDDADVHPGATELCDGVDDNCVSAEQDAANAPEWYRDFDGDLHGDPQSPINACTMPAGYVALDDDCDDTNPGVQPDAAEVCDTLDNDCDTLVDDADPDNLGDTTWYPDTDKDGHGDVTSSVIGCAPGADWSTIPDDCDDTKVAVHPGALEVCDDADNDCNGTTDENATDAPTWFRDSDRDGHGTSAQTTNACAQPSSYVASSDDCDDTNKATYPGATELCDLKDNDCDTVVDEGAINPGTYYVDSDNDTYGNPASTTQACGAPAGFVTNALDCNDGNKDVNPGVVEVIGSATCGNGIDDNCDTFGCEPRGAISLPTSAYWVIKGEGAGDNAGQIFVGADVDGDAKNDDDLIIGALGSDGYLTGTYIGGAVYTVTAPVPNTLLNTVTAEISEDTLTQRLPLALSTCDMDRDGKRDIVASADQPGTVNGVWRVRVFKSPQASPANMSSALITFMRTGGDSDQGGAALACGDINGDTFDDLIIGAPKYSATDDGAVWIARGRTTGYNTVHDFASAQSGHVTLAAEASGDGFGSSLAVGDFNGDGRADLAVGAPNNDVAGVNSGAVTLYTDVVAATRSATFRGEVASDKLGSVVTAGDLNGDSKDDLVVIAGGDLYVVFGRATWSTTPVNISTASQIRRNTPGTPAFVGDINSDGFDDLAVANGSTVFLWYGGSALNLATAPADATISLTSSSTVGRTGDVNGDGYDDLFVGSPNDDATGTDAGALFGLRGSGK